MLLDNINIVLFITMTT